MRKFVRALGAILIIMAMLPSPSIADKIILKNGRVIEATDCWEEKDLIKCKLYGQVIGYPKSSIKNFIVDTSPAEGRTNVFFFDIWQSGITVREAINTAEINDKPLHRNGLISVNKVFNPKMCRPYADTATQFYYKDHIFDKRATLTLNFTPSSKLLYSLTVAFSGPDISRSSEFRKRIEAVLRDKYGKPKVANKIVYETYDWKINDNATVTMQLGGNSIQVIYLDQILVNSAEKEKLEQVRKGFTINDKEKF